LVNYDRRSRHRNGDSDELVETTLAKGGLFIEALRYPPR
jgi:hypothetical protein